MSVDLREFEKFKNNIGKLTNNDELVRDIALEITRRLLAMLQKATPVDTGYLRNGWFVAALTKKGNGYEAEICNNTDYASYVNYGHRTPYGGWVDGKFFIELSVHELKDISEPLIRKKIEERLREAFK